MARKRRPTTLPGLGPIDNKAANEGREGSQRRPRGGNPPFPSKKKGRKK